MKRTQFLIFPWKYIIEFRKKAILPVAFTLLCFIVSSAKTLVVRGNMIEQNEQQQDSTKQVSEKGDKSEELKEVVVVGYGSARKKDLTGSVEVLGSKQFDGVSNTSPGLLLRGKVAGVQITQSSGEPGSATRIRVRGSSSVRSGNDPLFVVDGVPLAGGNVSPAGTSGKFGNVEAKNPLNFINEDDIESMTVLKDASSTAIYGARGANGVVLITTKKGKSQKPELSYSSSVQFSKKSGDFDVMTAEQFASASVAAGLTGQGQDFGDRSYSWDDAILRSAVSYNNSVSFNKATEDSNTRISFSANQIDGIVKTTGMDKYNISIYNSNDFFDNHLKVETRITYSDIEDKTQAISNDIGYEGNLLGAALYWNPTLPIYWNDDLLKFNTTGVTLKNNYGYTNVSNTYYNPVELLNSYSSTTNTGKFLGSINTTIKFNDNFKYQILFGVESSNSSRKLQTLPTFITSSSYTNPTNNKPMTGYAAIDAQDNMNKTLENSIVYDNTIGENVVLNALAGYSYYNYNTNGSNMNCDAFDISQTNLVDNIAGGLQSRFFISSYKNQVELQSYYGRVNASLFDKYSITATVRVDGSSKLGDNNKYGTFPSIGVADNLFANNEGMLNNLKIRANWGITGNQEFAANSAVGKARYGNNGVLSITNNANPDLKWESTNSIGIGTDFTVLNYRFSGSLDYFYRNTTNLIFPLPSEAIQPVPSTEARYVNLPGNLINSGVELSLNYTIIEKANMNWSIGGNMAFLKNNMQNFTGIVMTGGLSGQGLAGATAQVITNDKPLYSYYLFDFISYDADGNSLYADKDGNPTTIGYAQRKIIDKQPLPTVNFGFSSSYSYKNLDASVSFYGSAGHYIYNNTRNAYFVQSVFYGGKNVTPDVPTSGQSSSDPNSPSTKFLEKGDFLRMGELTVGYTIKGKFTEKLKMRNARVYANGSNLLLFTNYTGFDPEVDINKQYNGVPSAGIDYLAYPRSKGVAFGLNVTF